MEDIPENKLAALKSFIGDAEMPVNISELVADQVADVIENSVEIWPEDCEGGIGFFAAAGALWQDDSLNTKTKPKLLREIVEIHYIHDDDSGWESAELLGLELMALACELLASVARGKTKWPKEDV